MLQFPSTRRNSTLPASLPTAASTAPPSGQPADISGYEPRLHPDQLPNSVPGQGSLLHQMTKKKSTTAPRTRTKSAPAPRVQVKPVVSTTTKAKTVNQDKQSQANTANQPQAKTATQSQANKAKQSQAKSVNQPSQADTNMFNVEICSLNIPAWNMSIVVASTDYVRLRHGTYLNDIIVDFANFWLFQKAEPSIQDSIHLFPANFYVSLAALQRPRKGSVAEARELAEGLPLPDRRHGRVARWTQNTQLYDKDLVLFPICLDTGRSDGEKHWLLLAVLLGQDPVVVVMDSLGGDRQDQLTEVKEYMEVEARVKGREVPSFRVLRAQVPQQTDGYNCGVFVTMYVARVLADPAGFAARARQDQLGEWFLPSAVSGQRCRWAEVIRELGSSQAPRRARRLPSLEFEPPNTVTNIGCMKNLQMCCFVASAFLLLCWCQVPNNLLQGITQSQAQRNLATVLTTMATQRGDHRLGPMDPEPFVEAVNALGQEQFQYKVQMEDTCELMETVLRNLPLRQGFLVTSREQGTCQRCNTFEQQDSPMPWMNFTLGESRRSPACLATMLHTFTTTTAFHHGSTLNCQTCNIPVPAKFVLSAGDCTLAYWTFLTCVPAGELLLLQVTRNQNQTPLQEPASESAWGGRRLLAVATHRGAGSRSAGGHWRCHVRQGSIWWKLDSLPVGGERPEQCNPFLQQDTYKICMLAFK